VDVVRGKEVLAVACGVEIVEPVARRVGGDGGDEFGGFTFGGGDERGDCAGGLPRRHDLGIMLVGEIRFVEGE